MSWFDDLAKAAAGDRPSRSAVLHGLGGLFAGIAVAPLGISDAIASVRTPRVHAGTARVTKVRLRGRRAAKTFQRGACSYTLGETNSLSFSASSSSLQLTVRHQYAPDASSRGKSLSGSTVVDITDDGASLVHFEARFQRWNPGRGKTPDADFSWQYGAQVRGASRAQLSLRAGSIAGTVDGRSIAPHALAGAAPSSLRLADGRTLAIEAEPALRGMLAELAESVKREIATCRSSSSRHRAHALRSLDSLHIDEAVEVSHRDGRVESFEIAQAASGYIPGTSTYQNNGSTLDGPNTPNCQNAVANDWDVFGGCMAAAVVGSLFCPPCLAYGIAGCYTAVGGALLAAEAPGGPCNQVTCGSGALGPRSCDNGFTCCGTKDCCPSGYTCTPLGFCCPPNTISCGTDYDNAFCCPSTSTCGPIQGDDGTCVSCPNGQVAQNGQCCNFICGNDCCQSPDATCDHARGKCIYPNFGGATPRPKPGLDHCLRLSGRVTCVAPNLDNSTTALCCAPGVNCCAGECCAPGDTCGGRGSAFGCGRWIR